MDTKKKTAHIIPHSHWDREWRYPIWENRDLLVDFMDELIDLMESRPNYKQFIMDGQSVIIEDYLEIRPENRDRVERLVKDGRLAIGPWYTLPDLYPLDGECLIRNLLKGFRVSEEYGKVMPVAYTSFGWGQTAQLPQIYIGFGMEFCITAKRVTEKRAPQCEFWWEAPDGSRILTTRLGEGGRHKFFETVLVPARHNRTAKREVEFRWNYAGYIYHKANAEEDRSEYFRFGNEDGFYTDMLKDTLEECWEANSDSASGTDRFMLCGCDFSGADSILGKVIEEGNKAVDFELVHSDIDTYIKRLNETIDINELVTVNGELREGPSSACSGNALSTRLYIKQLNKQIQNLLIYKAEPINAAMLMMGEAYETGFLTRAWDFMLKSHAHDSINGVTQDSTVSDVLSRLAQARSISDIACRRGMKKLIRHADLSGYGDDVLLLVYNPLPFAREEIMKVTIDAPRVWDAFDIKITDHNGNAVDWQKIDMEEINVAVHDTNSRPEPFFADRHTVYIKTGDLPAGGFAVYKIEPDRPMERLFVCSTQYQRTSFGTEISRYDNELENEYLKLTVNNNGTINILHKPTGRVYENMHYFEETGEVGDYWINLRPNQNRKYTSICKNADVWVENNGELAATLGIRTVMDVPEKSVRPGNFVAEGSYRSDRLVPMTITSYITLKKGSDSIDVSVEIDNTASDHRVRAVYPTGIKAKHSYAHGHFTVDERPVVQQNGTEYEPDMQTLPMQTFVDISEDGEGFAFINNSLTEYEVKDNGAVYLTMLRGVHNNICTDGRVTSYYPEQTGGQCLGKRVCEYSLYPHDGSWYEAGVMRRAQRFNIVPYAVQTAGGSTGDIAPGADLVAVDNEAVVMSALKKAEDRDTVIMRLYNPTGSNISTGISFARQPVAAYLVNMNEVRQRDIDINKPLEIAEHKIITIELEF